MTSVNPKRRVAEAALDRLERGLLLGVGTGSTVNELIELLEPSHVEATVASSEATAARLTQRGIRVLELNDVNEALPLYIDGADEADPELNLIKGGGAALTREKIIAEASERFVCIVDASKQVEVLGRFPLPVEVIPMARHYLQREFAALGADPRWREGVVTDNGNDILDCHGLEIRDPLQLETALNALPGVVTVGLFARRKADELLVAHQNGTVEGFSARR